MNEVFQIVLSLSLSGSLLALFILLLRPIWKHRFSQSWQYYIWLLVLLRMVVPLSLPINFINDWILNQQVVEPTVVPSMTQNDQVYPHESTITPARNETNSKQETWIVTIIRQGMDSLWILWLGGAIMLLVRSISNYQSFVRYIYSGRKPVHEEALLTLNEEAAKQTTGKKPLPLYLNPLADSPMLVGILHPCILLPNIQLQEEHLYFVLIHEYTHHHRKDIFMKWFVQGVCCIHWFNPLLYWIRKEVGHCCETSCDERIIQNLSFEEKKSYGNTLIASLKTRGTYGANVTPITMNEDARRIKERLKVILNFKKKSVLLVSGMLAVTVLCLGIGAVCGMYQPNLKPQSQTSLLNNDQENTVREVSIGYISYYQDSYIFTLRCTTSLNNPDLYTLILNEIPIYYQKNMKSVVENSTIQKILLPVIEELHQSLQRSTTKRMNIVLDEVEGPYEKTGIELANQLIEENKQRSFAAVIRTFSEEQKKQYLNEVYQNNQLQAYCILIDDVKDETVQEYAKRSYQERRADYFYAAYDALEAPKEMAQQLAVQCVQENQMNYLYYMTYEITAEQGLQLMKTAAPTCQEDVIFALYNEDKYSMKETEELFDLALQAEYQEALLLLAENIGNTKLQQSIRQLYLDQNQVLLEPLLSIKPSSLSSEFMSEMAELAYQAKDTKWVEQFIQRADQKTQERLFKQAYTDRNLDMFYCLSYQNEKFVDAVDEIAKKAVEENEMKYFYPLVYSISETRVEELLNTSYEEKNSEVFYSLVEAAKEANLKLDTLFQKAVQEHQEDYIYAMIDSVEQSIIDKIIETAYTNQDVELVTTLGYFCSDEKFNDLIKRSQASQDELQRYFAEMKEYR